MSEQTHYSFVGRSDLGASPVSFVQSGKAWASIDADGALQLFDEAECREAAQRGEPYARMTVAIIEAERERCAKICESMQDNPGTFSTTPDECAAAIRAGGRSEHEVRRQMMNS